MFGFQFRFRLRSVLQRISFNVYIVVNTEGYDNYPKGPVEPIVDFHTEEMRNFWVFIKIKA